MRRDYLGSSSPDGDAPVPEWVLAGRSLVAAMKRLQRDPALLEAAEEAVAVARRAGQEFGLDPVLVEAKRNGAASAAWCAARGLSYCMTVLGGHRPDPREVAAGNTQGAGPRYAAAMQWQAEHRR